MTCATCGSPIDADGYCSSIPCTLARRGVAWHPGLPAQRTPHPVIMLWADGTTHLAANVPLAAQFLMAMQRPDADHHKLEIMLLVHAKGCALHPRDPLIRVAVDTTDMPDDQLGPAALALGRRLNLCPSCCNASHLPQITLPN